MSDSLVMEARKSPLYLWFDYSAWSEPPLPDICRKPAPFFQNSHLLQRLAANDASRSSCRKCVAQQAAINGVRHSYVIQRPIFVSDAPMSAEKCPFSPTGAGPKTGS